MAIQVWDCRDDIRNLVATPEIRARFNRIAPASPPQFHSHDLGGEIFLVLDGEVTFDVEGQVVTCRPGQAIFVPPHLKHRVYNAGDRPATYYLSVTPHVDPTHTNYDAALQRLPPRYGGWRGAGDPSPRSDAPTTDLADATVAEAEALARAAAETAAALARQAAQLKAAAASGDRAGLKQAMDAMWEAAYPTLRQVRQFEGTWNQLAPRAMPES
jgi:quercetin dioxygenase-like cupin family protein